MDAQGLKIMKHNFIALLAVLTIAVGSLLSSATAAVPLVRDGKAIAKIYHAPIPAPEPVRGRHAAALETPLAEAVRELNYHLQKMSDASLETVAVTDAASIKGPAIVLGDLAVKLGAVPQKTVASGEGFRLLVKGDLLLIGGQSDEAVRMGVYEVLSKLGCDWVMPGEIGEIIPRRSTVEIGALDESQAPAFVVRNMWYGGGQGSREEYASFHHWLRRQKGGSYQPAPAQTKGHAWSQFTRKHKAEFEKDPTMFALVRDANGQLVRKGPQIEVTHPRVLELFVQDIKDAFEKNGWTKDKEVGFPIGPADGYGYSLSPETLKIGAGRIDPISGELDRTDELVWLGNQIQARIEKEYPNVWLGFYNYSVHSAYPVRHKPHPRIAQIFAPISFSRFHSAVDPISKTQATYREVVGQWAKLAKEQGNQYIFRGYNWNLAENLMPYTKLRVWGEELPWYQQMGFIGLDVETVRSWGITGPSDWLFMKMAWNPGQDWKVLVSEYCRKAFGAGAPPMERYFLRLADRQSSAGQEAGSYNAIHLMYDGAFVQQAENDLAEATRLAQTETDKTRVSYFAPGVQTLKQFLQYHEAGRNFDFVAAQDFYNAIVETTKKAEALNPDIVAAKPGLGYLKRYNEMYLSGAVKYSTAPYRIVQRLPETLPTLLDKESVGEREGYFQPQMGDDKFKPTKTYNSTWDAQGIGSFNGAAWYRHRFTIPAELKGQPIGVLLGSFDDEARVWINGQLVGTSGRWYGRAAAFDLTDGLNYGGENVLTIEIVQNSFNELGVGGLMRSSYLFTGPQLELKAPKPLEQRRVLPGGAEGEVEG